MRPPADLFSTAAPAGLKHASNAIENLIADASNHTLIHLFENCIRHAGVLSWLMADTDKHFHLQALSSLFDFVKEETHRNPSLSLGQLVTLFILMEKEGIPLPLVQVSGSDTGVNLLTVHGSKGLEYEHVFMAGCNAGNWKKSGSPEEVIHFRILCFHRNPIIAMWKNCAGYFM